MNLVNFTLNEEGGNINLGPLVRGSIVIFLGLQYDSELSNWDLVSHSGFKNGEFIDCKLLSPTFYRGSITGAYPEFTDDTATGLVLVRKKKQVTCFEINEYGEVATYGERYR